MAKTGPGGLVCVWSGRIILGRENAASATDLCRARPVLIGPERRLVPIAGFSDRRESGSGLAARTKHHPGQ